MPRPALDIAWKDLPWSEKNNAEFARELGCHENTVGSHRAYWAPETVFPRGRARVFDLSTADFTRRDTHIAKAFGCAVKVVRRWRESHEVDACTEARRGGSGRPRGSRTKNRGGMKP